MTADRKAVQDATGLLREPSIGSTVAPTNSIPGHRAASGADIERVLALMLEAEPLNAALWCTSCLAGAAGSSRTAGSRICRGFALRPHRHEYSKLSCDPLFVERACSMSLVKILPQTSCEGMDLVRSD
jgi:hypothetical protein